MSLQSYNTGLLQSAKCPVLFTSKFSVNLATGLVTPLNGKLAYVTSGVATGVLTVTLPQAFAAIESVDCNVVDTALAGIVCVQTGAETIVNNKTQFQFTVCKASTTPVTTGTYIFTLYAVAVMK